MQQIRSSITPCYLTPSFTIAAMSKINPDEIETAQWTETVDPGKPTTVIDTYRSYSAEHRMEIEKKLVQRIDRRLLPLIVIIYLFNYLDRNSITQARLYGLQKDTHVNGAVYQTAISIFSAGYIAMQLPSTILMTKLRPSLFLVGSHLPLPSFQTDVYSRPVSLPGLS